MLEEGRSPRPVIVRKPMERANSFASVDSPGSLGSSSSSQRGRVPLRAALPAWNAENFQVGEGGRIVSLATMRTCEVFEKGEVVMELPPGSRVRVVEQGQGRRLRVRDVASGREGWISVRTAAGEMLLSKELAA